MKFTAATDKLYFVLIKNGKEKIILFDGEELMNHNEIESYVIRAKRGSQEDLLTILEQFKPFIFKTAASYNIKGCDTHDLVQMGYTAIIKAVLKYKQCSHTFNGYVIKAVKNEFRYASRRNCKASQEVSLNLPVNESLNPDSEYLDCIEGIENVEEYLINNEKLKELRQAVSKLPKDELEFVSMVYFNKLPVTAYAEKKKLSHYKAFKRNKTILEKLGTSLKQ
jgi:RNA polymerase sporulation-specific sigma factor